jgi:mercuric ion transport protein
MTVSVETKIERGNARFADSAGVIGAVLAALCCAGTPIIVGALAATGLSFLRKDALLWPVMLLSLLIALLGFWQGYRMHRALAPLALGIVGAVSLASGVIIVHGPPAMTMIYAGAVLLVVATLWNIWARRRVSLPRPAAHGLR